MKRITTFLLLFLSSTIASTQCYELVWSDEFDGTAIDATKWSFQTGAGGWGNNELQYYTDRSDNATVSNGKLQIIAKEENYMGANYTSARMRTINKGDWRYGRFEASIKLPGTQGIWPAFWMLPTENVYGTWPNSGEMDIMEHIGSFPERVFGTVHTEAFNHTNGTQQGSHYDSADVETTFHTYALEWTPNQVDVYLDEINYFTFTNSGNGPDEWPFDQFFHLIFNVAVGGSWPGSPDGTTVFPQTMEVDYVRVYQQLDEMELIGENLLQSFSQNLIYSVPDIAGATYTWEVPANVVLHSGQSTHSINVDWGNTGGMVRCTIETGCGTTIKEMMVELSDNFWKNPAFENDYQYWVQSLYNTGAADYNIVTSGVQQGAKSACVEVTQLGTDSWNVQLRRVGDVFQKDAIYDVSFWAKADVNDRQMSFAFINANTFAWYGGQTLMLTDDWQQYTYSITAPASVVISFNLDLGHELGTFCFDDFSLTQQPFCHSNSVEIDGPIVPHGDYRAKTELTTDGMVEATSSTSVTFTAETGITLNPGFQVTNDCSFIAEIEGCVLLPGNLLEGEKN